jgi:aspartyl-tRNA(Asn)/glutamyl-tRNA(Gln) amidotransferase subunit C
MSDMNASLVHHIAVLSNIPVTKSEEEKLAQGFSTTLAVVDKLMDVDTKNIEPTHQVTGLENVWREDKVDLSRTFSQEEALANAKNKHNGYFVVPQVIEQ